MRIIVLKGDTVQNWKKERKDLFIVILSVGGQFVSHREILDHLSCWLLRNCCCKRLIKSWSSCSLVGNMEKEESHSGGVWQEELGRQLGIKTTAALFLHVATLGAFARGLALPPLSGKWSSTLWCCLWITCPVPSRGDCSIQAQTGIYCVFC